MNTNKRVEKLISERLKQGQEEYGQDIPLDGKNGRDNLLESLYESLDLAVYIAATILEQLDKRKQMKEYIANFTDDIVLSDEEQVIVDKFKKDDAARTDDGSWNGR